MKLRQVFNKTPPNLKEYLKICGVKEDELELYIQGFYGKFKEHSYVLEDPFHYKNMESAVVLIKEILNTDNLVYIVQDCDVDGLLSSFLTYKFLKDHNKKLNIKILIHTNKSHGLTKEIMNQLNVDNSYLIIPDAGTNDIEQLKVLSKRGFKILIADHHEQERQNIEINYPPNVIIINSTFKDQILENPYLSGTGVMWKVCMAINGINAEQLLLVALANISDVMNITSLENRYLNNFLENYYYKIPFLQEIKKEWIKEKNMTPENTAWNITPKLNATIRSGNIDVLREIFVSLNYNDTNKIKELGVIKDLVKIHKSQNPIVEKIIEKILKDLNTNTKVIIGFCEKSPYIGLVANKLMSMFNKPILLLYEDDDTYKGSARSPIPFKDICENSELFIFTAGHESAFGVGFLKSNLHKIEQYFESLSFDIESEYDVVKSISNNDRHISLYIDMFDSYENLWGTGLPKPKWHIHINNFNLKDIKELGNGTTLKFSYGELDFIKFFVSNKQKKDWNIGENKKVSIDIIGELCYNIWRNKKTPQMIIDKIEFKDCKELSIDDLF